MLHQSSDTSGRLHSHKIKGNVYINTKTEKSLHHKRTQNVLLAQGKEEPTKASSRCLTINY